MENQSVSAVPVANSAPVKAAVICLIIAWVFALLPIPFISMMGMIVMNVAAFILAIICMSKSAVKHGVGVLIGSLIGTPIMYFLGLAILGAGIGNAISGHSKQVAQSAHAKQKSQSDEPVKASEFSGKWKGQFAYPNGAKAEFTLTLNNPSGNLVNGDMSEVDPSTKQLVSSIVSGEIESDMIEFTQRYSGQSQEATCTGQYSKISKQILGRCGAGNQYADFTAKKETGWLSL